MAFLDELQLIDLATPNSTNGDSAYVGGGKINGNFTAIAEEIDTINGQLDNVLIEKPISFQGLNPDWNRQAKAAAAINALTAFSISSVQSFGFSRIFTTGLDVDLPGGGVNVGFIKEWYYIKGKGKGNYGSGGVQLSSSDIVVGHIETSSAGVIELGDIDTAEVWDFMTANGPYIVGGVTEVRATQDEEEKRWLFIGPNDTYGTGATEVTANNFLEITEEGEIIINNTDLAPEVFEGTAVALSVDMLNRLAQLPDDEVTLTLNETTVEQAYNDGIFSIKTRVEFLGTGPHTVIDPDANEYVFEQGALVWIERRKTDAQGWIVKQWYGEDVIPTLQEVVEQGATSDRDIFINEIRIGRGQGNVSFNLVLGKNALNSLVSGDSNIAIGEDALKGITGGSNNVAIGLWALKNLTGTRNNNIAIGYLAGGNYDTGGSQPNVTDAAGSIFIGRSAWPLGNAQLNQIVIGDQATGNGSNTATIGNNSILKTFLKGALKLVARTKASVTGLAAGLFIFDSEDSNRPTIHNGTEWKGLAYKDETDLQGVTDNGNETDNMIKVDSFNIGSGNAGFASLYLATTNIHANPQYSTIIGYSAGSGASSNVQNVVFIGANAGGNNSYSKVIIISTGEAGIEAQATKENQIVFKTFSKTARFNTDNIPNGLTGGNYDLPGYSGALETKPQTTTGTEIPLDRTAGRINATPAYNATYTTSGAVAGGNATLLIDTTGEVAFPGVTGATLVTGSDFEAGAIYEMHVYTLDGTDVRYYFLYLEPA